MTSFFGGEPFARSIINNEERPSATDLNLASSQVDQTHRFLPQQFTNIATSSTNVVATSIGGFVGDGFRVVGNGLNDQLQISSGLGWMFASSVNTIAFGGVLGANDKPPYKPILLSSPLVIPIAPRDPTLPRIDVICVTYAPLLTDPSQRVTFDPVAQVFTPGLVKKTFTWDVSSSVATHVAPLQSTQAVQYITGVPNSTPVPPTLGVFSSNFFVVAQILVHPGQPAPLTASVIQDLRPMFFGKSATGRIGLTCMVGNNSLTPTATTCLAAITASATTIAYTGVHLADPARFPPVGFVQIDNEIISYPVNNAVGDVFTGCTRGVLGTVPTAHAAGATITLLPVSSVQTPPGVAIAVSNASGLTPLGDTYVLYIVAGGAGSTNTGTATVPLDVMAVAPMITEFAVAFGVSSGFDVRLSSVFNGPATAADQTALASSALTAPTLPIAVGQPIIKLTYRYRRLFSSGALGVTDIFSDLLYATHSVFLRRNA